MNPILNPSPSLNNGSAKKSSIVLDKNPSPSKPLSSNPSTGNLNSMSKAPYEYKSPYKVNSNPPSSVNQVPRPSSTRDRINQIISTPQHQSTNKMLSHNNSKKLINENNINSNIQNNNLEQKYLVNPIKIMEPNKRIIPVNSNQNGPVHNNFLKVLDQLVKIITEL